MTKYESLSLLAAYLNLLVSFGGLGLLYYGIREMAKGAEIRAADSESKHTETMTASQRRHEEVMTESERRHNEFLADSRRREEEGIRRHEEAMEDIRSREEEGLHRHKEAMEDIQRRDEEGLRRHDEAMASLRELIGGQAESRMALRELIERTG